MDCLVEFLGVYHSCIKQVVENAKAIGNSHAQILNRVVDYVRQWFIERSE